MTECETCRHGIAGKDDVYTDGRRYYCKDCGRIGVAVTLSAEVTHSRRSRKRERLLEQIGSTAQAAVETGLVTAEDLHREIDEASR